MLEPHGITIEDISDSPTWFTDYTWTYKESLDFRKWAIHFINKKKRMGLKRADKEFQWFNLSFGLRYSDDPYSPENIEIEKTYKFYW